MVTGATLGSSVRPVSWSATRARQAGIRAAVLPRSAAEPAETVTTIGQRGGGSALAVPGDVNDPDQVRATLDVIDRTWGPVDILTDNAAVVWPLGPSTQIDIDEWVPALAINVTAVARLTVLPAIARPGLEAGRQRVQRHRPPTRPGCSGPTLTPPPRPPSKPTPSTWPPKSPTRGHGQRLPARRGRHRQAWIRPQDPVPVGASLIARLAGPEQTARVWDASDPLSQRHVIPSTSR